MQLFFYTIKKIYLGISLSQEQGNLLTYFDFFIAIFVFEW